MKSNSQPATKRDLAELESRLEARLDTQLGPSAKGIREALKARTESLQQVLRDFQSEILKGFLRHHETQNVLLRLLMNTASVLHQRMETVELRLVEIEKRLLLNPRNPDPNR